MAVIFGEESTMPINENGIKPLKGESPEEGRSVKFFYNILIIGL
jgi:hypothetical protein